MHKNYLAIAAFSGALGVGLGAFGAHELQSLTSDEKILHGFQTAVQYQLYHAIVLLAVGILYEKYDSPRLKWAATCFITGIILFSGSLYALTFFKLQGSSLAEIAGPVTPVGGLFLIAGWLFLLLAVLKQK